MMTTVLLGVLFALGLLLTIIAIGQRVEAKNDTRPEANRPTVRTRAYGIYVRLRRPAYSAMKFMAVGAVVAGLFILIYKDHVEQTRRIDNIVAGYRMVTIGERVVLPTFNKDSDGIPAFPHLAKRVEPLPSVTWYAVAEPVVISRETKVQELPGRQANWPEAWWYSKDPSRATVWEGKITPYYEGETTICRQPSKVDISFIECWEVEVKLDLDPRT